MKNKGQQEMVGFVLIVVLVVVIMMVFLVLSLREPAYEVTESLEVANMLNSIMGYTTKCAIVFVPRYDTVEDLIKSANDGDYCTNLDLSADVYLETVLTELLEALILSESTISGYELQIVSKDEVGEQGKLEILGGDCENSVGSSSAQRLISSGAEKLIIRLKLCEMGS